jgi:AcrR family transcriptional regulator
MNQSGIKLFFSRLKTAKYIRKDFLSNLNDGQQTAVAKRVYAKKSAADRVLERQERLLQAGLQLFATQGYAHTTIEALCSEAKVTTRHFYQCFNGREALLVAVYDQMIEELQIGLLAAIQAEHQTIQEKIQQIIQALVTHYLTDTRRAQVGVLEVVGASPAVEQRRREVIHGIVDYVQLFLNKLMQEKQLPERNYYWLAVAMVGGINEMMAEWLMNPCITLEELVQEIINTINFMAGHQGN